MLWLVFGLMTVAAFAAVGWPLAGRRALVRFGHDVAVYKDQLSEVDRDQNWGLIAAGEAEASRVEVSRRLIAAAAKAKAEPAAGAGPAGRRGLVGAVVLVAIPVAALSLYLKLGSPDIPGQPLAARIATAHGGDSSIELAFARIQQHLEQNPEDGRGWEVVAPIYMRLGRYDDAARARGNALRLLGATAERESDYGEALVSVTNGMVTAEAKAAFERALRLDAKDVTGRFYVGLAAEQDGRGEEAARLWRGLIADAPAGAEWLPSVQRALARLDGSAPAPVATLSAGTEESGAALAQDPTIRAMVDRLAARLKQDGSDVEGWIRLVRSYTVMQDSAQVRAAGDAARTALAGSPDKLARLETGIKEIAAGQPPASAPAALAPTAQAEPPLAPSPAMDPTIRAMVDRLAARLKQDGSDVEGWIRLVRSYTVMQDSAQARAAGDAARTALAGSPDKLVRLETGIKEIAAGQPPSALGAPAAPAMAAPAASSPPGPAAAVPESQDQMIRGMVDRLAARLAQDGSDVDGWLRLLRSYKVMGEADKTRAALGEARRALKDDADKLRRLDDGLKELGIPG